MLSSLSYLVSRSKNTLMKHVFYFLVLMMSFFLSSFFVHAACDPENSSSAAGFLAGCAQTTGNNVGIIPSAETGREDVKSRVVSIATAAISLGSLLAVGALVWAGRQYTMVYGNDEKIKQAKNTAVYALIGLLLLLASFGLVETFINMLYEITSTN